MPRVIQPPLDQLPNLPTPLTEGERQVLELFNTQLPESWEIYVQPHLNGLRPDFVLLNRRVGIGVFEVKDWDLAAMDYWAQPGARGKLPKLMARNREGTTFSREAENPVSKVRRYFVATRKRSSICIVPIYPTSKDWEQSLQASF